MRFEIKVGSDEFEGVTVVGEDDSRGADRHGGPVTVYVLNNVHIGAGGAKKGRPAWQIALWVFGVFLATVVTPVLAYGFVTGDFSPLSTMRDLGVDLFSAAVEAAISMAGVK